MFLDWCLKKTDMTDVGIVTMVTVDYFSILN